MDFFNRRTYRKKGGNQQDYNITIITKKTDGTETTRTVTLNLYTYNGKTIIRNNPNNLIILTILVNLLKNSTTNIKLNFNGSIEISMKRMVLALIKQYVEVLSYKNLHRDVGALGFNIDNIIGFYNRYRDGIDYSAVITGEPYINTSTQEYSNFIGFIQNGRRSGEMVKESNPPSMDADAFNPYKESPEVGVNFPSHVGFYKKSKKMLKEKEKEKVRKLKEKERERARRQKEKEKVRKLKEKLRNKNI